jgi:hypothetical protein
MDLTQFFQELPFAITALCAEHVNEYSGRNLRCHIPFDDERVKCLCMHGQKKILTWPADTAERLITLEGKETKH